MRDDLVQLALLQGSPAVADHLKRSIRQHRSAKLTGVSLRMVEQASKLAAAARVPGVIESKWSRACASGWLIEQRNVRYEPAAATSPAHSAATVRIRRTKSVDCA
jgi:hypothetical protein